jgi:hypothetical protein
MAILIAIQLLIAITIVVAWCWRDLKRELTQRPLRPYLEFDDEDDNDAALDQSRGDRDS